MGTKRRISPEASGTVRIGRIGCQFPRPLHNILLRDRVVAGIFRILWAFPDCAMSGNALAGFPVGHGQLVAGLEIDLAETEGQIGCNRLMKSFPFRIKFR